MGIADSSFRPIMNDYTSAPSCTITRHTIQNLLHHAMSDEYCAGLLFASEADPFVILRLKLAGADRAVDTSAPVDEQNLICVGLFHLENQDAESLISLMPESYITLTVSLSEQGRLDLNAVYHQAGVVKKLPLDLIEDGQLEADA